MLALLLKLLRTLSILKQFSVSKEFSSLKNLFSDIDIQFEPLKKEIIIREKSTEIKISISDDVLYSELFNAYREFMKDKKS